MNEQIIWERLSKEFNNYAVAGIMGNLYAESNLNPQNLQNSYEKLLNMNDEQYTRSVDSGTYKNFVNDSAGYGLAQWTYYSRKQKLLDLAQEQKKSIGDINLQLNYLIKEVKEDKVLLAVLEGATTIKQASDIILTRYEKPADMGEAVKKYRTECGQKYYDMFVNKTIKKGDIGENVRELQQKLIQLGYSCGPDGADGDFGQNTYAAVINFQKDNGLKVDGIVDETMLQLLSKLLNSSQPMGLTADRLLQIARNEIGYHEKQSNACLDDKTANSGSNNWTKYARDLAAAGYYNGNKNGFAWCDVFTDWCFYQLAGKDARKAQDIQCQTGDLGAACKYSAQYYKQQNRWSGEPQVGAQIFFFYDGDINHTGIVEKFDSSTVTTIEGNSSDQVARRTYQRNYNAISGYGLPKFDDKNTSVAEKYKVTAWSLYVRTGPNINTPATGIFLHQNEIYEIDQINGRYGHLANGKGWVCLDWMKKI